MQNFVYHARVQAEPEGGFSVSFEARRILDPDHATSLPRLEAALQALGRRLVVGVAAA